MTNKYNAREKRTRRKAKLQRKAEKVKLAIKTAAARKS
jgi:hypothetical protein